MRLLPVRSRNWLLAVLLAIAGGASAQSTDPEEAIEREEAAPDTWFGRGPLDRWLKPHDLYRDDLQQRHGFAWVAIFSPMVQLGTEGSQTLNEVLDVFAYWEGVLEHPTLGRSSIEVYLTHAQDGLTNTTTSELAEDLGLVMLTNDVDADVVENAIAVLAWEQVMFQERLRLLVGQLEPDSTFDENEFLGYDRESFFAQPLANNPVRPSLGSGLGAALWVRPNASFYGMGGLISQAGDPRYPDVGALDDDVYLKFIEFGYTPELTGAGQGNYRVAWSRLDSSKEHPSSNAVMLSFDQELGPDYALALRYAYSDGDVVPTKRFGSIGFIWRRAFGRNNDWLGIGAFWGDPSESHVDGDPSNPRLDDEYGAELFWRAQLTDRAQITTDLQLRKPSNDESDDLEAVLGFRLAIFF